ncbi:subtilisin-like protein [Mycena floridula]|nr:subtilisin-like protein [Mycena floridula]
MRQQNETNTYLMVHMTWWSSISRTMQAIPWDLATVIITQCLNIGIPSMLWHRPIVMSFRRLFVAVCILPFVYATSFVVHDRRASIPSGFVKTQAAPANEVINFRLNLASNNLEGLESQLMAAADPSSPTFRQWLSSAEVEAFAAPTAETSSAVASWLSNNGISFETTTPAGDWISFSVPVEKANSLLNTEFSVFTHVASGSQSIRTLEFSVPAELQEHIRLVHPTTAFSRTRAPPVVEMIKNTKRATPAASCNATITPSCLQALYNIPTTPATSKTNVIGVAGFDDQFANNADLKTFLTSFRPDMSSATTFTLTPVDGGTNSQTSSQAGVEANLDIQYTVGLATNVPTTFVTVGTRTKDGADEGFLDIITALLGETTPPQVLTTSYGFNTEQDLSLSLTVAMCNAYMQLTAKGTSILFATGDGGVAATPGETCSAMFNPTFPTCPFTTLVGATEFIPERGAELSAGGFSNYFAQQSWQADAVNAYLTKLGSTNAGKFNRTGRAYPDVAAIGQRVEIVVSGSKGLVAGTSCSSPIFASVIGLINDRLVTASKPVLGFLNPWLYANPQMFNDITTGNNPGCGTSGFPALAGWDPVTGLGTPNFPLMLTAAGL